MGKKRITSATHFLQNGKFSNENYLELRGYSPI